MRRNRTTRRLATIAAALTLAITVSASPVDAGGWHVERITWYGPHFYGHRTACGQTIDRKLIGVAARGIGCGTRIEIRYAGHDRIVRVIDYCPGCSTWHLDATARLAIHLTGHPPHTIERALWRIIR